MDSRLEQIKGQLKRMPVAEIPRRKWKSFCNQFSDKYHNRPVSLETFNAELSTYTLAQSLPLQRIIVNPKDQNENTIFIVFGEEQQNRVTHVITAPTRIRLKQSKAGSDNALKIKAADGATTIVRPAALEPSPHSPQPPEDKKRKDLRS